MENIFQELKYKPQDFLPKEATCVHQGKLFDTYQWPQKQFDGSIKTFEAVYTPGSVQIFVITPQKKIILLKEEQPHAGKFLSVPGGHIERNEHPYENMKKELLEELGMESKEVSLWNIQSKGKKLIWNTFYFIAKNCQKVQEPQLEPGEKVESYEVNFEEFLQEVQRDDFRNKDFQNIVFKLEQNPQKLEQFKQELFK